MKMKRGPGKLLALWRSFRSSSPPAAVVTGDTTTTAGERSEPPDHGKVVIRPHRRQASRPRPQQKAWARSRSQW